jgi:quinoprotein glucose dehydrogenase
MGDLIVTAATVEPLLRAYRKKDGREVWRANLPVPAQSTPMTYLAGRKQYLVVCAGGHGLIGTAKSDEVIAFALPTP